MLVMGVVGDNAHDPALTKVLRRFGSKSGRLTFSELI
jgi:hypothetical protein